MSQFTFNPLPNNMPAVRRNTTPEFRAELRRMREDRQSGQRTHNFLRGLGRSQRESSRSATASTRQTGTGDSPQAGAPTGGVQGYGTYNPVGTPIVGERFANFGINVVAGGGGRGSFASGGARLAAQEADMARIRGLQQAEVQQGDGLQQAFDTDAEAQRAAIERANADRRAGLGDVVGTVRSRLEQAGTENVDLIRTADRDAGRLVSGTVARANAVLGDLGDRNRQAQEQAVFGVSQDAQVEMTRIDQDPLLTPAQKTQAKQRIKQAANQQVSGFIGQLESQFQALKAQTGTALAGQIAGARESAANIRAQARIQAQANMAAANAAAVNGFLQTAAVLSNPDQVFSEFDSLVNFSLARQGLEGNA